MQLNLWGRVMVKADSRLVKLGTAVFVLLNFFGVSSCFAQTNQEGPVFNVFASGKIQIGAGNNAIEHCQPLFYNTPQQNALIPNFASQGQCTNLTNQTSSIVGATGIVAGKKLLPSFLSTSSSLDVNFASLQQVWIKDGSATPNIFDVNGQSNVSAGTIVKNGSLLTLPSGEYGRIQAQNGGLLHLKGALQGVRIKEFNVYGCDNGNIEIEPGDYFIEKMTWYGNCNLKVTGTVGVARLFVKNGFVINQPSCWNLAANTCGTSMNLSGIQTQLPERLSISVYQGDFTLQGGAQLSAGLYVDNGNITFNNGPNSSFVGESFAKNITTQNNPGASYAYKPTELTQSVTPTLALIAPSRDALTNNATPTISYQLGAMCGAQSCGYLNTYFSGYKVNAILDGQPIAPFVFDVSNGQVNFLPPSSMSEGLHKLVAYVVDVNGRKSATVNDQFTIDTIAPKFLSIQPKDGTQLLTSNLTLSGEVDDPGASVVLIDSDKWGNTGVNPAGANFAWKINLKPGGNLVKLSAVDKAGNSSDLQLNLSYLNSPPPAPALDKIVAGKLNNGVVVLTGSTGAITPGLTLFVTDTNSGKSFSVVADAAGSFQLSVTASAGDTLSLQVSNANGALSSAVQIKLESDIPPAPPLPPDPSTVAPPLPANTPTQLVASTAFLYSGQNPIQTGVAPGVIQAKTAGLLRGKILTRDNHALPGVVVSILNHPEFGQTISRADGMFDMVINAGGAYTLNYARAGFLNVQRTIPVSWGEYAIADDIVMIPLDGASSVVDLTLKNGIQIARANVVSDQDGSRQATILIPSGTTANVVMPNGDLKPLSTATIRTTEYTVGDNGPKAMPGALPTSSAYTYAAEVSVDEAVAVGSDHVQFNQPVYYYVENFLKFPVGAVVPSGYYDREKAGWISSKNGVIIKILGVQNGLAQIDSVGAGTPDNTSRLQQINVSDEERMQLAKLYSIGATLWRVPLTHFTPWDFNWPWAPPLGASPPGAPPPQGTPPLPAPDDEPPPVDDPDEECGSIIECQNRSLGESIPIVGTSFSINYKSSRMLGRFIDRINIPLSNAYLPDGVKRIVVDVKIAGRYLHSEFEPTLNQNFTFKWDGLDAYGRPAVGMQIASIFVGYVYPAKYLNSLADYENSFSKWGETTQILGDRKNLEVILGRTSFVKMGTTMPLVDKLSLGGWTLSENHSYDQNSNVLAMGDGRWFNPSILGNDIQTVAGMKAQGVDEDDASFGDGKLATLANIPWPSSITKDRLGNLFVSEGIPFGNLRKVTPQGIISTVKGVLASGENWNLTGGLAGGGLTSDANDNIYISLGARVVKLNPKGQISTVAGNGKFDNHSLSTDSTDPKGSILSAPSGLALDGQSSLYILDRNWGSLIKISPDGQSFALLVGGGAPGCGSLGDGGVATQATLCKPSDLVLDRLGNIYISDTGNHRIRKISVDGIITTVAGNGVKGNSGNYGLAVDMSIHSPRGIAVDKSGNIYFSDSQNNVIRIVTPDGMMRTFAGSGQAADNTYALQSILTVPTSLYLNDEGIYFSDSSNRVRKISGGNFNSARDISAAISSRDGSQLFTIDGQMRHTRTQSTLNGADLYRFNYDDKGYLVQILDNKGLVTSIERDSNENVTAIVAPRGQRTKLTLDSNGYLASVSNPAQEAFTMKYDSRGMLTAFTKPNGVSSSISYDANGNLVDDKILGSGWSFSRMNLSSTSYYIDKSSGMGRTTRYQVENLSNGDILRTNTFADGTKNIKLRKATGNTLQTDADGTVTASINVSDPRFGIQSEYVASKTVSTPGGLQYQFSQTKQVNLRNSKDVLSVVNQVQTSTRNGKTSTATFTAAQNLWSMTSAAGRSQNVYVDTIGNPLKMQQTGLDDVSYSYDAEGKLIKVMQGSRHIDYTYDGLGNIATETNSVGKTTTYEYDLAGRIVKQNYPNGQSVSFAYDASGNLTGITPPSRPTHLFQYNGVDDLQNYTPPSVASAGGTQYKYNGDRQITQIQRPDGLIISLNYNPSGKLESLVTPDGNTAFAYSDAGQLTQLTKQDGSQINFAYDGFLPISQSWGGNANPVRGKVNYAYNNDFLVKEIQVQGVAKSYAYDNDNLLTQAGDISYKRDSNTGVISGSQLGNVTTSSGYNGFGELSEEQASVLAGKIYNATYQRDNLGRIIASTEVINGIQDNYIYEYGDLNELTSVTKNGALIRTYNYDANGNRLGVTTSDGKVILANYDNQDRLLQFGSNAYDYGRNGETKSKSSGTATTQYVYDVMGSLTQVLLPDGTRLDYLIDAGNRRVGKKVNGQLVQSFLYENQLRPAAELDNDGNVKSRFIYGTSTNVPDYMEQNGKRYRFIKNHLGSPRLIIDADIGTVVQRIDYDEWGNVVLDSNPGFQPFGFAGGLYDRDTRLTRFGARDYDAEIGRWTAKDPIGFAGGDNSLYAYVGGSPVSFVDPTGLMCTFNQSTGSMVCQNNGTGEVYYRGDGYSGTADGRNNSSAQDQQSVGPIPRGSWRVGDTYDSSNTGPNTMRLIPMPGNKCAGRDCSSFRMHGNNKKNDASHGCIIQDPKRTGIPAGEIVTVISGDD